MAQLEESGERKDSPLCRIRKYGCGRRHCCNCIRYVRRRRGAGGVWTEVPLPYLQGDGSYPHPGYGVADRGGYLIQDLALTDPDGNAIMLDQHV